MTNGTTRRTALAAAIAASLAGAFNAGQAHAAPVTRGKLRKARKRCRPSTLKRALRGGFENVGIVIEIKGDDLDAIRAVCNEATLASGECQAVAGGMVTWSIDGYVDTLIRRIEAGR
jgi:hypothetical protein